MKATEHHASCTTHHRSSRSALTLYHDDLIHVTDCWVRVNGRCFPVADLWPVGVGRAPCDGYVPVSAVTATALLLVGMVGTVAGRLTFAAACFAGAGLLAAVALGGWRRRPYELWAGYDGMDVRLFWCHDATRFGKVARALARAREMAR